MNKQISVAAIAVLVSGIFIGCDRGTPEPAPGKVPAIVDQSVIAVIDGTPFTTSQVAEVVMVQARIMELAKRKMPAGQFPAWANAFAVRLTPGLIQAYLLEKAIAAEGIAPTALSDAAMVAKYNRLTHQKAVAMEELSALFGENSAAFRKQFARESRFEAFYQAHSNELAVTQKDIDDFYIMKTNTIIRSRKISEAGWVKARKTHARLKSGETWEKVAKEVSEDGEVEPTNADNWKEWMTIPKTKIESKELAAAVEKLKEGEYTEPIDIDEGLVIVRLNARDGDMCELARILIRMGCEVEVPDLEDARRQIAKQKRLDLQTEILEKAHEKSKIEYPNGPNLARKIWQSAAPRRKIKMKK